MRVSCWNFNLEICFLGSPSATAINGSSLPNSPSKLPSVSPMVQQGAGTSPAPASPLTALGSGKQSFYYRDPALPHGWYIRVDRTQVGIGLAYFICNSNENIAKPAKKICHLRIKTGII